MLEYLSMMSDEVSMRHSTMLTNLRSGSNSFFDSYRELVQDFAFYVIGSEGVVTSRKIDLSRLLGSEELARILLSVGTTDTAIAKIKDYILKINKHVHKREKIASFEDVYNYILALYDFTAPYAENKGLFPKKPTMNTVHEIYAEYERTMSRQEAFISGARENGSKNTVSPPPRRTHSRSDIVGSSLVFDATYSTYKAAKGIFTAIFLLFFAYSIWFISVHIEDYSLAYITIPYQIFTLVHFINFLRLSYDSQLYDLDRFSMYKIDISNGMPYISRIKKRHIILVIITSLLGICVMLSNNPGNVNPEVFAQRWMYLPFIIFMVVIFIYGAVYYSFYKGIHAVLEVDLSQREHVYIMGGKKYTSPEFNKYYYNQ